MELEFKGRSDPKSYKYTMSDSLTGRDFLDLRRAVSTPGGKIDMTTYGHMNIAKRLTKWSRPEPISDDALLNLPQDVYQVLYNTGFRLDSEEVAEANRFLAESLSPSLQQELSSILAASNEPPPIEPEDSSPSESKE